MALTCTFYLGPGGRISVEVKGEGITPQVFSGREIIQVLTHVQERLEACYGPDGEPDITNIRRDIFATSTEDAKDKLLASIFTNSIGPAEITLDKLGDLWGKPESDPITDIQEWANAIYKKGP